jgi:hypothetical protein
MWAMSVACSHTDWAPTAQTQNKCAAGSQRHQVARNSAYSKCMSIDEDDSDDNCDDGAAAAAAVADDDDGDEHVVQCCVVEIHVCKCARVRMCDG